MNRFASRGAIAAVFATLSACGGGAGKLASTPRPTPKPVAFPLAKTATFESITSIRKERRDGAPNQIRVTEQGSTGRGPAVTIKYDAAANSYTLTGSGVTATFDRASGSVDGNFDTYTITTAQSRDDLRILRNVQPSSNIGVQLSYASFGSWTHLNTDTTDRSVAYFLFGEPTTAAGMPRTGTASYDLLVDGNIRDFAPTIDGVTEFKVGGSGTLTADFAAMTVTTDLTLIRSDQRALGSYTGTGTIGADQFNGPLASTGPYFQSGFLMGGFFGPAAKEAGYTFSIHNYNPDPYAGASINYVDQWIVGAAVGTKKAQ